MITIFKNEFTKSLLKLKDKKLKDELVSIIQEVEAAENSSQIKNLKKLAGYKSFYRIRMGDYRIGIKIETHTVTFAAFAHRKDIYKHFP
ncbi:MAG: type II toxin-antitoxin system RelE/ParE family toxin [Chitinophagaceae bacterium]|nr:type II toxin-antitoxin system RelE/ParE family toxin [Chitinophagaceae bacterium]